MPVLETDSTARSKQLDGTVLVTVDQEQGVGVNLGAPRHVPARVAAPILQATVLAGQEKVRVAIGASSACSMAEATVFLSNPDTLTGNPSIGRPTGKSMDWQIGGDPSSDTSTGQRMRCVHHAQQDSLDFVQFLAAQGVDPFGGLVVDAEDRQGEITGLDTFQSFGQVRGTGLLYVSSHRSLRFLRSLISLIGLRLVVRRRTVAHPTRAYERRASDSQDQRAVDAPLRPLGRPVLGLAGRSVAGDSRPVGSVP